MKCAECQREFPFIPCGMGSSNAPGYYFRTGIVVAVLMVGFLIAQIWDLAVMTAFAVLVLIGWSFVARTEGYPPDCPHCGHKNDLSVVKPWSM